MELILPSLDKWLDSIHIQLGLGESVGEKIATRMTDSMDLAYTTTPQSVSEHLESVNAHLENEISTAFHGMRRYLMDFCKEQVDRAERIICQIDYEQSGWDYHFILRAYSAKLEVSDGPNGA
jgi:hypothetical protein